MEYIHGHKDMEDIGLHGRHTKNMDTKTWKTVHVIGGSRIL